MGIETAILVATIASVAAAGVSTGVGAYQANKASKDANSDALDAQNEAKAFEQRTKEAEANAVAAAKEETKKKLAQQTQTIFTNGLGVQNGKDNKQTTFGVS